MRTGGSARFFLDFQHLFLDGYAEKVTAHQQAAEHRVQGGTCVAHEGPQAMDPMEVQRGMDGPGQVQQHI